MSTLETVIGVPRANQTITYAVQPQGHVLISLPPSLHPLLGHELMVPRAPSSTLADIKMTIEAQIGTSTSLQTLSAGGVVLTNDSATLETYGIPSGGAMSVSVPTTAQPPFIVFVELPPSWHSLEWPTVKLVTSAEETLSRIKIKIETITSIQAVAQTLLYYGVCLCNESMTLGGAGVRSGDSLQLRGQHLIIESALLHSHGLLDDGAIDLNTPSFFVRIALPPMLKQSHGQMLTIWTTEWASIGGLKIEIASITGIGKDDQYLFFGSLPLLAESLTLSAAGIVSGDTVELMRTSSIAPPLTPSAPPPSSPAAKCQWCIVVIVAACCCCCCCICCVGGCILCRRRRQPKEPAPRLAPAITAVLAARWMRQPDPAITPKKTTSGGGLLNALKFVLMVTRPYASTVDPKKFLRPRPKSRNGSRHNAVSRDGLGDTPGREVAHQNTSETLPSPQVLPSPSEPYLDESQSASLTHVPSPNAKKLILKRGSSEVKSQIFL